VCQVLPSKGVAAFEVRLPAGSPQPARVEWRLDGEPVDNAYLAEGLVANVTNTQVSASGETFVFGEVTNTSGNTYSRSYVCAAWKNAAGQVVRVERVNAAGLKFAPGQKLPFGVSAKLPPDAVKVDFHLDSGVTPPGETPPTYQTLPATALTNSFSARGVNTPLGFLSVLFGEVKNTTGRAAFIEAATVYRDGAGKIVGVDSGGDLCPVAVPPGGTAFAGGIATSPSAPVSASTSIEANLAPVGVNPIFPATSNVTFSFAAGIVAVRGTVRNTSSSTLEFVDVCAAVYDATGRVVGVGSWFVPGPLAPSASKQFEVVLGAVAEPTSAKAIAQGYE
jgi:hypothetical protein